LAGEIDAPPPIVHGCCVAICGPVDNESVQSGPSLPEQGPTGWGIDTHKVKQALGPAIKHICLVNDFVAVGYGLTAVNEEHLTQVHGGKRNPAGVMAAVGAGTGLGQVYLTWSGGRHVAQASEGGMAEFHARSEKEWGLRQYLMKRDGYATVEGVVSGPGIVNAYRYLWEKRCSEHRTGGDEDALEGIPEDEKSQHASRIVEKALKQEDDAKSDGCEKEAVEMFITALAGGRNNDWNAQSTHTMPPLPQPLIQTPPSPLLSAFAHSRSSWCALLHIGTHHSCNTHATPFSLPSRRPLARCSHPLPSIQRTFHHRRHRAEA
jgi:glucokinase